MNHRRTATGLLVLFFIGMLISSCDPKEELAAYVTVEPFEFTPGTDGVYSTKITDGWIYVDNEFLGAFDLPKTIPVLKSGENVITIDPGIRENGINATPDLYTFYKRYTETLMLEPGNTVVVQPSTTYDEDKTNFVFKELFEDSPHRFTFDLDGNGGTKINITGSDVKEGAGAGRVYLDTDNAVFGAGSDYIFDPPATGLTAYIEMDYKNDVPLYVGLAGYGSSDELLFSEVNLGVNPKEEWNKIYFNVTDKLQQLAIEGSVKYRIIIQAQIPRENGGFALENAEIYLDNIKLVSL